MMKRSVRSSGGVTQHKLKDVIFNVSILAPLCDRKKMLRADTPQETEIQWGKVKNKIPI